MSEARRKVMCAVLAVAAVVSCLNLEAQQLAPKLVYRWTLKGNDLYSASGSTQGEQLRKLSFAGYVLMEYNDASASFGKPVLVKAWNDKSKKMNLFSEEWFCNGDAKFTLRGVAEKDTYYTISKKDEQYMGAIKNGVKYEDKVFLVPKQYVGMRAWNCVFKSGATSVGKALLSMTYDKKKSELVGVVDKSAGKPMNAVDADGDDIVFEDVIGSGPGWAAKYVSVLKLDKFKKVDPDEEQGGGDIDWSNIDINGGTIDGVSIGMEADCIGMFRQLFVGTADQKYGFPTTPGTAGQSLVVGADGNFAFGNPNADSIDASKVTGLSAAVDARFGTDSFNGLIDKRFGNDSFFACVDKRFGTDSFNNWVDDRFSKVQGPNIQKFIDNLFKDAVSRQTFLEVLAKAILDNPSWFNISGSLDAEKLAELLGKLDAAKLEALFLSKINLDDLLKNITTETITKEILANLDKSELLKILYESDKDAFKTYVIDKIKADLANLLSGLDKTLVEKYITENIDATTIVNMMDSQDLDSMRSNLGLVKCNYKATAAPAKTDDANKGYSKGSMWYDNSGAQLYMCSDPKAGSAAWGTLGLTAAEKAKLGFVSVSAATDLDSMRTDVAALKTKNAFISVTGAVNLDTIKTDNAKNKTDILTLSGTVTGIKTKTDLLTATTAANIDTMQSDITTLKTTASYPAADKTKVGYLTVTTDTNLDQIRGDVATMKSNGILTSSEVQRVQSIKGSGTSSQLQKNVNLDKIRSVIQNLLDNDVGGCRTNTGITSASLEQ